MRLKRQKFNRKTVRFYTACYGFRAPFKVLCDGTFVYHLLVNQITPADTAISNLLGAPVKLFTTKCVIAELKRLGQSHNASLGAANSLITARCDHERGQSADDCLADIIGENNSEHFFVATQDSPLRKKLHEIPGVPLLFGLRKSILLEPPSATQCQFVKISEEKRSHMTETEYNILKKRAMSILTSGEDNNPSNDEGLEDQKLVVQAVRKTHNARKGMAVKDRVQFKRKKAKGPNPLSCKKKMPANANPVPKKEKRDGDSNGGNGGRKRKRSRRHKKSAQADQG